MLNHIFACWTQDCLPSSQEMLAACRPDADACPYDCNEGGDCRRTDFAVIIRKTVSYMVHDCHGATLPRARVLECAVTSSTRPSRALFRLRQSLLFMSAKRFGRTSNSGASSIAASLRDIVPAPLEDMGVRGFSAPPTAARG